MKKILSKILIGANFISIGLFVNNLNSLGMDSKLVAAIERYKECSAWDKVNDEDLDASLNKFKEADDELKKL